MGPLPTEGPEGKEGGPPRGLPQNALERRMGPKGAPKERDEGEGALMPPRAPLGGP